MLTAVSAIIVFCVIIFIHELGHFVTAKLFGVTVNEFSVGMGPRLGGFRRGGTDYSLRALPLGGYVKLEGEDGESEDTNAFCNKPRYARLIVLAAGAFMNFVLGFLLFAIIMSCAASFATNKVGTVLENSAFADAGIQVGDEIIAMHGDSYSTKVRTYNDITYFMYKNSNNSAEIIFRRDGAEFGVVTAPKYSDENGRYLLGFKPMPEDKTFFGVLKYTWYQSLFVIKVVLFSFVDLIKGSVPASDISGPVGIVGEIGNAARNGILSLINLAALISLNLGVVNLLPLPALDGGRILFVLIEMIRRKPVPPDKEAMVHALGFVLLIGFMLVITFFDISKLV